jgi:hypothetical protein
VHEPELVGADRGRCSIRLERGVVGGFAGRVHQQPRHLVDHHVPIVLVQHLAGRERREGGVERACGDGVEAAAAAAAAAAAVPEVKGNVARRARGNGGGEWRGPAACGGEVGDGGSRLHSLVRLEFSSGSENASK